MNCKECGLCKKISDIDIAFTIPTSSDFLKVDTDIRLVSTVNKILSQITRMVSQSLLDLRLSKFKFCHCTYYIIKVKSSLWTNFLLQALNFFEAKIYYDCENLSKLLIKLSDDIERTYISKIKDLNTEIAHKFLEVHKKPHTIFRKRLEGIDSNEVLSSVQILGDYIQAIIAMSVCTSASIDLKLKGENYLFILPEVFLLNDSFSYIETIVKALDFDKFRIYYINPAPRSKLLTKYYLEKANLLDKVIL